MTRTIQSLFGYDRAHATPEEIEAYKVANEALQYRVNMISRRGCGSRTSMRPTTDSFGRPI